MVTGTGLEPMSVDATTFRSIMGSFPAGVVVVTALDEDGHPRGLTSTAVCSVSLEPPMLLVCVDRQSVTLPALLYRKSFVVNFLAAGQEPMSRLFATKHPEKFQRIPWRPSDVCDGAPVLRDGCVAHAECLTVQEIDAGDHVVLIGRVAGGEAAVEDCPLMFRLGQYRGWPDEIAPARPAAAE